MRSFVVGVLSIVFVLAALSCKKKGSEQSSRGRGMGAVPMEMTAPDMGGEMRPEMAGEMEASASMKPEMAPDVKLSDGPTGVAICDKMLEVVCTCQKKADSLRLACTNVKKDAPSWKARAKRRDPKELAELAKSCERVLKSIQENYKECK